jgi:hypothetical protein
MIQTTHSVIFTAKGPLLLYSHLAQNSNRFAWDIPGGDELRQQDGLRRLPMSPHSVGRPVRQVRGQALPGNGRAIIGPETLQNQGIFFPTPGPVGLQKLPPLLDSVGGRGFRQTARDCRPRKLLAR